MSLENKVVLVTGGTGSFGQKFTEVALRDHNPKAIRILSRGELLQRDMEIKFNDSRLRFFIGDVRDKDRIHRALDGVDIVIHAAALKQVPTCEYSPFEAVKTNILGSMNVIECALERGVKKALAISTDKAVQSLNLYGATKAVMEKSWIQSNSYSGQKGTKFSCVRYGNVAFSRGSVLPLFMEQAKSGSITITDTRMTRFWLTLEQGVDFVLQALEEMQGGEIFVPKLKAFSLSALADLLAPGSKREIVGIRPGEKLHEVLLTKEEARHTIEFENHLVILPEHPFWKTRLFGGSPLAEDFEYASNAVEQLNEEEMKEII